MDFLVKKHIFENRSRAIQEALEEKLERIKQSRLIKECENLDPKFEQAMAEQWLSEGLKQWPEY